MEAAEYAKGLDDRAVDGGNAIIMFVVTWISYISSLQLPPQYSKLLPGHSTLQSVGGWAPLPALGDAPQ